MASLPASTGKALFARECVIKASDATISLQITMPTSRLERQTLPFIELIFISPSTSSKSFNYSSIPV
jgi:hypothetical protein